MRHNVDGRKLGRNTSHRVALFKNLANAVIQNESIVTTVEKAKEARRVVDRLITLAKAGDLNSRRLAFSRTRSDAVVKKLFSVLAERYKSRNGGYTRILKLSDLRWGDAARMALLELIDRPQVEPKKRRKPKAEAKGAQGEQQGAEGKAAEGAPKEASKEPFGKFRRMFAGKSKVGAQDAKAHHARAGGAGRKTPAGGGGSKTGGSS